MTAGGAGKPHSSTRTRFLLAKSQRPTKGLWLLVVVSKNTNELKRAAT